MFNRYNININQGDTIVRVPTEGIEDRLDKIQNTMESEGDKQRKFICEKENAHKWKKYLDFTECSIIELARPVDGPYFDREYCADANIRKECTLCGRDEFIEKKEQICISVTDRELMLMQVPHEARSEVGRYMVEGKLSEKLLKE